MLKIKSNSNEFTIIFSEKIGKKINAEKFSVPALSFFQLQRRTFLPFSASVPFLFFFLSGQRAVSFLFSPLSFFSSVSALFLVSVQRHFSCFCSALFLVSVQRPFLFLFSALSFFFCFNTLFFLSTSFLFVQPTSKVKNILFRCFRFLLFE